MIKFADESEITGKIKNDGDCVYVEEINSFVKWCDDPVCSYMLLVILHQHAKVGC